MSPSVNSSTPHGSRLHPETKTWTFFCSAESFINSLRLHFRWIEPDSFFLLTPFLAFSLRVCGACWQEICLYGNKLHTSTQITWFIDSSDTLTGWECCEWFIQSDDVFGFTASRLQADLPARMGVFFTQFWGRPASFSPVDVLPLEVFILNIRTQLQL